MRRNRISAGPPLVKPAQAVLAPEVVIQESQRLRVPAIASSSCEQEPAFYDVDESTSLYGLLLGTKRFGQLEVVIEVVLRKPRGHHGGLTWAQNALLCFKVLCDAQQPFHVKGKRCPAEDG